MLITIWGRDGNGKSTLADYLGSLLARKNLAAVIDTDLTQPTLPIRLSGTRFVRENSMGRAVAGTGTIEVKRYLHQHPRQEGLFFAGLLNGDDYMAYEIGLDAEPAASLFVKNCLAVVDHVVLDCSGQRTDPFVPVGLKESDRILILLTPDLQGICWWKAVEPLLRQMNVLDKVWPILSIVQKHHQDSWVQEGIEVNFKAKLPFTSELNILRCSGKPIEDLITGSGRDWNKDLRRLYEDLIRTGSDAS